MIDYRLQLFDNVGVFFGDETFEDEVFTGEVLETEDALSVFF